MNVLCSRCKFHIFLPRTLQNRSIVSTVNRASDIKRRSRLKEKKRRDAENSKLCAAFSTGESYNLELIKKYFIKDSSQFTLGHLPNDANDSLHFVKTGNNPDDSSDIFLFRRLGSFVCWNLNEVEISNIRQVLQEYELEPYPKELVEEGSEEMHYFNLAEDTSLVDGDIYLYNNNNGEQESLEKYAFSNAMALSVKVDMWEARLEDFSDSMRHIPEILKRGHKIRMLRKDVMQKIGELLTLKHQINLYSDLLTTPDFYWDRDNLEKIYSKTCTYLEISKRTKIMNEKLNLCTELVEILRSHLNEQHSHRLEWMIIFLIMVEVIFEVIRLAERNFKFS